MYLSLFLLQTILLSDVIIALFCNFVGAFKNKQKKGQSTMFDAFSIVGCQCPGYFRQRKVIDKPGSLH